MKKETSILRVDKLDPNFKNEIAKEAGGEAIKNCFQCGTCAASCPVMRANPEYNPRKIIWMVMLGMREEVLKSDFIWLCSACYSCLERCPQNVKVTELMNAIKNLAVKEGYMPESMDKLKEVLEQHGRTYEISDFENKKRARYNLPAIKEKPRDIKEILSKKEKK